MQKEKILKFGIYLMLTLLIALFIVSLILPKQFTLFLDEAKWFLSHFFQVKGWVLVLISFLSVLGLIKLYELILSFYPEAFEYQDYKSDLFKNTQWKWKWNEAEIENLWCFCPTCNQELSYKCDHLLFKTELLCQKCEKRITTYDGDNINYVLTRVKSEIRRVLQRRINENNK